MSLATPTPAGLTPRTMISDPVIVTLGGSGVAVSESTAAPVLSKPAPRPAGADGKSKASDECEESSQIRPPPRDPSKSETTVRCDASGPISCGRGGGNESACVI